MTQIPDDKQLEHLLSNIQATPSASLHDKLADAPWHQSEEDNKVVEFPKKRQQIPIARMAAAVAVVLIAAIIFVPPVRTTAQQIASWFFPPAASNTRSDSYVSAEPTAFAPQTYENTVPALADIQREVGFTFAMPQRIPAGYHLTDVTTQPNMVQLWYEMGDSDPLERHIYIRIEANAPTQNMEVGKDAVVETLTVDDRTLDYVQGGWLTTDATANDGVVTSTWDNSVQMVQIAWYDDAQGLQYNLLYQAAYIPHPAYYGDGAPEQAGYLTRDDLLDFVASIP